MKSEWQLFCFQLKKMKFCFLGSVLYVYLIVFTLQFGMIQQYEKIESMKMLFFGSAQKYLPILGIVWGIWLNRIYFEDHIAEIIYATDRLPKIRFNFYFYIFLQLLLVPMYVWYDWLYQDKSEILRLILQMAAIQFGLFFGGSLFCSGILAAGATICLTMLMQYIWDPTAFWNYFQLTVSAENITNAQWLFTGMSIVVFLMGSIVLERIRFQFS